MSNKSINNTNRQQLTLFEQNPNQCVQNYHKLMKMKKLLADTEMKMFNRIKLFEKASEKVLRKKRHETNVTAKFQQLRRKDPAFSRNQERPKTRQQRPKTQQKLQSLKHSMNLKQNYFDLFVPQRKNIEIRNQNLQPLKKVSIEKINEERQKNAKLMKQDRQRNKIIIEQRRKKELTRKLESANQIRRERERAKLIKQQVANQKHEDYLKFFEQKYSKEKEEFIKMQNHLQKLQEKEKQALITWKRTIEENDY